MYTNRLKKPEFFVCEKSIGFINLLSFFMNKSSEIFLRVPGTCLMISMCSTKHYKLKYYIIICKYSSDSECSVATYVCIKKNHACELHILLHGKHNYVYNV